MKSNEALSLGTIILIAILGNLFPYLPSYAQLCISITLNGYIFFIYIKYNKQNKDTVIANCLFSISIIGAISLLVYVLFSKFLNLSSYYLNAILIVSGVSIFYLIMRVMHRFKMKNYTMYKELTKKLRFLLILAVIIVIPTLIVVYSVVSKK